eukprot:7516889-Ditylum_brightwellii.AAC.1
MFCPCGKAVPLCLCVGRGCVVEERECYVSWFIALWALKLGKGVCEDRRVKCLSLMVEMASEGMVKDATAAVINW